MQTQKEVILIVVSAAFLIYILVSFILRMLFFHKKKQEDYLKSVEAIKNNFEKELLKTRLEIQEETFQHISRELHDHIGHFLSLAKLRLGTLQPANDARDRETLDASMALITESLDEIRNIAKSLNAESVASNGLIKTASQQVDQIKKTGRFSIEFIVSGQTCFLDDQKEIVLFRIIQEGLNNILKHSEATNVYINLHYETQQLVLTIRDDGIGFNTSLVNTTGLKGSSGIRNIMKRSSLINAAHEINSVPGIGTTLKIITPY